MATDSLASTRRAPAARKRKPHLLPATVVALHVVAVTWLSAGGGLYIDDIRAQAYAAGRSFYPFVIESNRTHLAPGARTIDWFMARYAPLEHWPAVVITALIALLLGYATTRLVSRIIAHPVARGLAIAWVLFAASVIPTYAWFRQAITVMLPLGLLLLLASLVLDHLRSGRWQPLAGAVGLHVIALTFSERALAVPFVVLALIVVADGVRWRSARWWARSASRLGPFVVVNVLFLLVYLGGDFDKAEGSRPSLSDAATKIGRWALVDLLPSYLGGPVVWRSANGAYSFAATPTWLVAAAATLFVIGLIVAARTRGSLRAAGPVALVAAAYAVPVLGMIYVFRLAQVEDITAADDLRLLPDVSAAVALALAALVGTVLERRRQARATEKPVTRWTVGLGALAAHVRGAVHDHVGRLRDALAHLRRSRLSRQPPHRGAGDDRPGAAGSRPRGDHPRLGRPRLHHGAAHRAAQPRCSLGRAVRRAVRRRPDRLARGCRARAASQGLTCPRASVARCCLRVSAPSPSPSSTTRPTSGDRSSWSASSSATQSG